MTALQPAGSTYALIICCLCHLPAGDTSIEAAMATMAGLQPLGNTLATARVMTKTPFLLKGWVYSTGGRGIFRA